jgi:hypothetical protein
MDAISAVGWWNLWRFLAVNTVAGGSTAGFFSDGAGRRW